MEFLSFCGLIRARGRCPNRGNDIGCEFLHSGFRGYFREDSCNCCGKARLLRASSLPSGVQNEYWLCHYVGSFRRKWHCCRDSGSTTGGRFSHCIRCFG